MRLSQEVMRLAACLRRRILEQLLEALVYRLALGGGGRRLQRYGERGVRVSSACVLVCVCVCVCVHP